MAYTTGIGLSLAIIALKGAGVAHKSDATRVTLGDLHSSSVVLASTGSIAIVVPNRLGAILIGIVGVRISSVFSGDNNSCGVFCSPPSIALTFLNLEFGAAMSGGILSVVLVFFLVGPFDATGWAESVAGVQPGGRTEVTALAVAALVLASRFISPPVGSLHVYATATAPVLCGLLNA